MRDLKVVAVHVPAPAQHVVGLGAEYVGHPALQPSVTVARPLDGEARQPADFMIVLGVDVKVPSDPPARAAKPLSI